MSKMIEFPDPLYAEIDGYAQRICASPLTVIRRAWDQFREHHEEESIDIKVPQDQAKQELLHMVRTFHGSISLPSDTDDKTLIAKARAEKYGPL
jgi:hypothetical protein